MLTFGRLSIAPVWRTVTKTLKEFGSVRSCRYSSKPSPVVADIKQSLDMDHSRLKKDVLLYQNERTAYFKGVALLNVIQFVVWIYSANFAFKHMGRLANKINNMANEDDKQQTEALATPSLSSLSSLKQAFQENRVFCLLSLCFVTVGYLSAVALTLFTVRSVRYVILRSGGDRVRITCFSILGLVNRYRHHDVPLAHVSARSLRSTPIGPYVTLKIKGKPLFFIIDKKGHFYQPKLFDETVGLHRNLR